MLLSLVSPAVGLADAHALLQRRVVDLPDVDAPLQGPQVRLRAGQVRGRDGQGDPAGQDAAGDGRALLLPPEADATAGRQEQGSRTSG